MDFGIGIQTCTAKMSVCGGWAELYHYSVFGEAGVNSTTIQCLHYKILIEMCIFLFFFCFQWIAD